MKSTRVVLGKKLVLAFLALSLTACDFYSRAVCTDENAADLPLAGRYFGLDNNSDVRWTVTRTGLGQFRVRNASVDRWGDISNEPQEFSFRTCRVNGQNYFELSLNPNQGNAFILARLTGAEEIGCREASQIGFQFLGFPQTGLAGFQRQAEEGILSELVRHFQPTAEGGVSREIQVQGMVPIPRDRLDFGRVARDCRK